MLQCKNRTHLLHFQKDVRTIGPMETRQKYYKLFLLFVTVAVVSWVAVTAYQGKYIEAVAISGVSSILLWFALGISKSADDD